MWSIPPDFGGQTHTMLRRSITLAERWDRVVEVLMFHPSRDLDTIRDELRARGLLTERIRLRELWTELADLEDSTLAGWDFDHLGAPAEASGLGPPTRHSDHVSARTKRLEHDLDHKSFVVHRRDGSLLAQHDWIGNAAEPATNPWGDRALTTTLFDHSSSPVGTWDGIHPLHQRWLDLVLADEQCCLMVDDATAASTIVHYRRPNVTTIMIWHSAHLKRGRMAPYAALSAWRKYSIERGSRFDAVVFLTERQRVEADLLLGPTPGTRVVPNLCIVDDAKAPGLDRDRAHGVTVARLAPGKRLDHAIHAVHRVHDTADAVTLTVHGSGEMAKDLTALIDSLGAHDHVMMAGYTTDVHRAFSEASFSLLTSITEAFGLVLVESMAAGCVPFAYDIPYGPAEIITHGVDGYLVPPGDVDALARQIQQFLREDPRAVRDMRSAAIARAKEFSPATIANQWATVLRDARRRKSSEAPPDRATIRAAEEAAGRIRAEGARVDATLVEATWTDGVLRARLRLVLHLRGDPSGATPSAQLVHAPTGRRTPLRVRTLGTPLTGSDGCVDLDVEMETSKLTDDEPPWVLMVGLERAGVRYEDTIRRRSVGGPLAPLPLAPVTAEDRFTCHLEHDGWGLVLRRTRPHVTALGSVDGRHVTIEVVPHDAATDVAGMTLGSPGSSEVLSARQTGAGRWELDVPLDDGAQERRWDLRAVDSGQKRRKIAWAGDRLALAAASPRSGPVWLDATSYGYLGISVQRHRPVVSRLGTQEEELVVDLLDSDLTLTLHGPGEQHLPLHQVAADPADDPRLAIALTTVPAGTWDLVAHDAAEPSTGVRVVATEDVQRGLPIELDAVVTISATRGGHLRVTRTDPA